MENEFVKPLREMQIGSLEVAQRRLVKRMMDEEGLTLKIIFPINNFRYSIIKFKEKTIMLMYKREPFYNFGTQFRSLGHKGVGESVNVSDLQMALKFKVSEIYSIFPSGIAYMITFADFMKKSVSWRNKEFKDVRSVSIHELKRAYDLRLE